MRELARELGTRIEAQSALGAFLARDEALTLAQARMADERLAAGQGDPCREQGGIGAPALVLPRLEQSAGAVEPLPGRVQSTFQDLELDKIAQADRGLFQHLTLLGRAP